MPDAGLGGDIQEHLALLQPIDCVPCHQEKVVDSLERRRESFDLIEVEFNQRNPKILSFGEAADCSRDFERRVFH